MSYPPTAPPLNRTHTSGSTVPLAQEGTASPGATTQLTPMYDAERAQDISGLPYTSERSKARTSSWDLLGGMRKLEHSYEEFDSRNAASAHLAYADGDLPKNKVRVRIPPT